MLFCCLWRNVGTSCHKHFVVVSRQQQTQPLTTSDKCHVVHRRRVDNTCIRRRQGHDLGSSSCTVKRSWPASCSTVASSTQRATIVNNKFRPSHSVYNSWQHLRCEDGPAQLKTAVIWRQVEQEAALIFEHIYASAGGYYVFTVFRCLDPEHVLHFLLPPPKVTGHDLRKRSYGLTLTSTQSSFVRKNFIQRMLYKAICWHYFACMIVVYNVL